MCPSQPEQADCALRWDYHLSPSHRQLRADIRRFADEHIRPQAAAIDEQGVYPSDVLLKLAEAGFTAAAFPTDLGGTNLDSVSWSLIIEEVARASGSAGLALGVSGTAILPLLPLLHLSIEKQREAILPVLRGETPGVYAQSEPDAGSDVAQIKTTARHAVADGVTGWEINGQKLWISNAWLAPNKRARWAVVLAQTGEIGDRRAMRFFLVPLDAPGIEVVKLNTTGMRATGTAQLFFDHVFVPEDALIGQGEAGFQTAMRVLGASRIFFSARGLGILKASVATAKQVADHLRQTAPDDPRLNSAEARLAELRTGAAYLSVLLYEVARLRDAGKPFELEVASLKWLAGHTAVQVTTQAYILVGSLGGSPQARADAERFMRDANQIPLAEGTSEVMERILARDLARTLQSDGGATISQLLTDPEPLIQRLSEPQDPASAVTLLLDLAKAAYRQAIQQSQGEQPVHLLPPDDAGPDVEPDEMPLSPIPSPRQEPLGAERFLASLQTLAFGTTAFQKALPQPSTPGPLHPDEAAARQLLVTNVLAALDQARELFLSLDHLLYWFHLSQLGSPEEPSHLEQMMRRVVARTLDPIHNPAPVSGGSSDDPGLLQHGPVELAPVAVNEPQVKLFARVSGDRNPYHLDPDYAKSSRYQGQIGHGVLTVGLALAQISRRLPGYVPQELEVSRFTAPVRFGDRLRAVILGVERHDDCWLLRYTVNNQDGVAILDGSVRLRPRTPGDGPLSWAETLGRPLSQLADEAEAWASDVQPFPVRPAPKLASGDTAQYGATISPQRLGATVALFNNSPWLTALFALHAVAQASAELAPGFILVGLEASDLLRPFKPGESLAINATVTRQGTLAHRPLDRIRIDVAVTDASGAVVCRGAVYKESEAPVEPVPPAAPGPYPGVEFAVPTTPRLLESFGRLYLSPHVSLLDLTSATTAGERPVAVDAVVHHLNATPRERRALLQHSYLFLQASLHGDGVGEALVKVLRQAGELIDGILLTDTVTPGEVRAADRLLSAIEQERGWTAGRFKLELCIGHAARASGLKRLAAASSRVGGLVLRDARLRDALLRTARAAGIDAIDGTTRPNDDARRTALDAVRAAMLGFHRKWAFNPVQLNAVLNPRLYLSQRDMERAGIPQEWIERVLAHDLRQPTLWPQSHLTKKPSP